MLNQAVIFCGGFGKRLMPITKKIPKPMVNVNGKPFLFHLIQQCKNNGIKKIFVRQARPKSLCASFAMAYIYYERRF